MGNLYTYISELVQQFVFYRGEGVLDTTVGFRPKKLSDMVWLVLGKGEA